MKKIVMIIFLFISGVIGLILIGNSKIKKIYTDINGVKYAIYVDGSPSTSFPVGNYKVEVTCENAYGYWDYYQRKIIISDISNNVSCNVDFSSIIDNDYLNTYILGLVGSTQGNGQLIHETGELADYTNSTIIKSFGTTPVYFRNTSNTSNTQTEVNSYWTFNSSTGVFTSDPTKFTESGSTALYHAYMNVPSAGYYQVCYTFAQSPNPNNYLYIIKNTTQISYFSSPSSGSANEVCFDIGYFESTDYLNISERGYSGTSAPVITFRIEKSNNVNSIDTGYRYEGKNPNNYIMFNNELWRIIGVFDETSHGNSNKSLVKIIRQDSLGSLAWYGYYNNDWSTSTLKKLLNEQYYDWETYKSTVNNNCTISYSIAGSCDYSVYGIHDEYRIMIKNSTWYLGGAGKDGYNSYRPLNIYSYERDANAIYTGRQTSVQAYIGLMYESDFLLSVPSTSCSRLKEHDSYGNDSCAGNSWLTYADEWVLNPKSNSSSEAWYVYNNGYMIGQSVTNANMVRPVLYLHEDVYRISGTGSITDPYIIGIASS